MSDEQDSTTGEEAESFLDKAKGRVKEAAGDLLGDEGLQGQGQREQERGELKEDAAEAQAQAEQQQAKAQAQQEQAEAKRDAAERREG